MAMKEGDLTVTIYIKKGPNGKYAEVDVKKPDGMSIQEVCGWIDQAKLDLQLNSSVGEQSMKHQCPVCGEYKDENIIMHNFPCWDCKVVHADKRLREENLRVTNSWDD